LETWKKSQALPLPENVTIKQLADLRKEYDATLIALQMKQADCRSNRDRIVRLEQEVSSLNGDIRRLTAEMQTKNELLQANQERLRQKEADSQALRQLQEENDILRKDIQKKMEEYLRLQKENVELLGRLHIHLEVIPENLREAFITPVERERDECKRTTERHLQTLKKIEKENVEVKVEIADLKNRLTHMYDKEVELQRKVVQRDLQLERLSPYEAEANAAVINAQIFSERESLAMQRFEQTQTELEKVKEALNVEKQNNKKLEQIVKNIPVIQSLGESMNLLQSSLHNVGSTQK